MLFRQIIGVCLALTLWGRALPAWGITWAMGSVAGVMQVPASEYQYAIYGAYADLGQDARNFIARAIYVERPKFEANGFVDQDFIVALAVGGRVIGNKDGGLNVLVGYGKASGYIEAEKTTNLVGTGIQNRHDSYALNGIFLEADYERRWSNFLVSVGHQVLSGVPDNRQFDAKVGYSFPSFLLKLGYIR